MGLNWRSCFAHWFITGMASGDFSRDATQGYDGVEVGIGQKFSSPNRVLVRSFRMSRDRWRQESQGASARAEAAKAIARQRLRELDSLRERGDQREGQLAAPKK